MDVLVHGNYNNNYKVIVIVEALERVMCDVTKMRL